MSKMNLTLIVAVSENNVIGNNIIDENGIEKCEIPWRKTKEDREKYSEDMKRFKELTLNHDIIMGGKTYRSIPKNFRPLEKRKNIILTRSGFSEEGIYPAKSLYEALCLCEAVSSCDEKKNSYIAGGTEVYKQFLPLADKMEITKIHSNFKGNVFFPEIDWSEWVETKKELKIGYSFLTYERK